MKIAQVLFNETMKVEMKRAKTQGYVHKDFENILKLVGMAGLDGLEITDEHKVFAGFCAHMLLVKPLGPVKIELTMMPIDKPPTLH